MLEKRKKRNLYQELLAFQLFQKNPSRGILLFGPEGSDMNGIAQEIARVLHAEFVRVTLDTLYERMHENSKCASLEYALLSEFEISKSKRVVLHFEDCECLFHRKALVGIVCTYLKSQEKLWTEQKKIAEQCSPNSNSQTTKLGTFCVFSTSKPLEFPEILLDKIGVPVYVPLPTKEERKEHIKRELQQYYQKYGGTSHGPRLDALSNWIADESRLCSLNKISNYIDLVFGKKKWEASMQNDKLVMPTEEDFRSLKYIFEANLITEDEFECYQQFAERYGYPIENYELPDIEHYTDRKVELYLGKRKLPNGTWEVKVQWKNQWVMAEELPFLTQEDMDKLEDFTEKKNSNKKEYDAAKNLHELITTNLKSVESLGASEDEIASEYAENGKTSHENGCNGVAQNHEVNNLDEEIQYSDTPLTRSKKRKLSFDSTSSSSPKRKKSNQYPEGTVITGEAYEKETSKFADESESIKNLDDDDYEVTSPTSRRRQSRRSPKRTPSKKGKNIKMNGSPTALSPLSPEKSLSPKPQKRVKWYHTYKGALAYAILKAKSWAVRRNGYLDVHLESDKKKFGGSVYDWDILWLGMKLIPGLCINQTHGVNAARKLVKNHYLVKPKLTEWRKTRTYDDEELKKIFMVNIVNSEEELDKFMSKYKSWTEDDEERLLYECKMRAGIIDFGDAYHYIHLENQQSGQKSIKNKYLDSPVR